MSPQQIISIESSSESNAAPIWVPELKRHRKSYFPFDKISEVRKYLTIIPVLLQLKLPWLNLNVVRRLIIRIEEVKTAYESE